VNDDVGVGNNNIMPAPMISCMYLSGGVMRYFIIKPEGGRYPC